MIQDIRILIKNFTYDGLFTQLKTPLGIPSQNSAGKHVFVYISSTKYLEQIVLSKIYRPMKQMLST